MLCRFARGIRGIGDSPKDSSPQKGPASLNSSISRCPRESWPFFGDFFASKAHSFPSAINARIPRVFLAHPRVASVQARRAVPNVNRVIIQPLACSWYGFGERYIRVYYQPDVT